MSNRQEAAVFEVFERALDCIQTRAVTLVPSLSSTTGLAPGAALAVAYSGGLDSSALLHLAQRYAATRGLRLLAFHVHHGLSPNADAWLEHCERECKRRDIPFAAKRIHLADLVRDGTEQAARIGRYAALGELCRAHSVPLLLTAHHLDDQAETVLLQLLRGAGVAGLSGMSVANGAPDLLGGEIPVVGRPLLGICRAELELFVSQVPIAHVDDESNGDMRFARNALRKKIMPVLAEFFPGFQQRVVRSSHHAQAAQRMLVDLAGNDLAACLEGECLDLERLNALSTERMDNVLRHWFAVRGVRMPSTAWLSEMRAQLLEAKDDAQICVTHADCIIRRHRNRIHLTPRVDGNALAGLVETFRWQGEAFLAFPSWGGRLFFDVAERGVDASWLRGRQLQMSSRQGGEILKPAPNRPSRSLKHHFQAQSIPAWERIQLPVVIDGDGLLFAAGIGMNWRNKQVREGTGICFRWERDQL